MMTNGMALALAAQKCVYCAGSGLIGRQMVTCNCVWRAVFRACYGQFRRAQEYQGFVRRSSCEWEQYATNKPIRTARLEDFAADFALLARRALRGRTLNAAIFRLHYLMGAEWRECSARLGVDRGTFFHEVYRVQQRVGKVFSEIEPYPLYPLDEYFFGTIKRVSTAAAFESTERLRFGLPLRAPLQFERRAA